MITIEDNIKRAFFYLDYLRMHAYARKNKIFRKNRYMINHATVNDPKKGYKAYIQRLFRDLVITELDFLEIKKPRDVFGYNVDNASQYQSFNDAEMRYLPIFEEKLAKIRYAYKRYLVYGEYFDLFEKLGLILRKNPTLFHNIGLAFKIRLNETKSDSWTAFQGIKEIAKVFEEIEQAVLPEECIKNTIVALLDKVMKPVVGMQLYKLDRQGVPQTGIVYTITEVRPRLNNNNHVQGYRLTCAIPNRQSVSIDTPAVQIIHNAEVTQGMPESTLTRELCQIATSLMRESTGIDDSSALRLAKATLLSNYQGQDNQLILITNIEITQELIEYMRGML